MSGTDNVETAPVASQDSGGLGWRDWVFIAGNIGQLIAGLAVVVSLIFVGVQLKAASEGLLRSERNASFDQFSMAGRALIENRDMAEVFVRNLSGDNSMDAADQFRLEVWLTMYGFIAQTSWERESLGLTDAGEFDRIALPTLVNMRCTRGGSSWWNTYKGQYLPDFVRYLDDVVGQMSPDSCPAKAPAQPVAEIVEEVLAED